MPERVFLLARHRARTDRPDQLLAGEIVERLRHVGRLPVAHRREGARPEHLAHHGSVLEQALAIRRERIQAGGDDGLDGVRHLRAGVLVPLIGEQADELFGIERIAAGALQELLQDRRREQHALQQPGDELAGLRVVERIQVDPLRVAGVRPEGRMAFVELRSRRAQEEERNAAHPVGEILDEGEERVVRPVQILEHQHGRSLGCEALDESPPRGHGFLERRRLGRCAHERREPREEPAALRVGLGDLQRKLGRGLSRAIRLLDPALGLDDLAERPERDPVSVREAASLAPAHESRRVLDLPQQLGAQPALADPRLAHDRHQLAGALPRCTGERAAEDLPFQLTPDHRRVDGASHVRAEARPGPQGPPDHDRRRLALDRDWLQRLPFEHAGRGAIGLVGDGDGVHRGGSLQARGGVDHVAGDESLARFRASTEGDHRLPGVDAYTNLQGQRGVAAVEVVDRFDQPQTGAHRTLGVVLVRQRRPEHPHHRVADELLHRSAEALDLVPHARVIPAEAAGDVFGVGAIRGFRKPDEVDEQGAHDLPLLARRGRVARERTAARLAELRPVRIRLAARRTAQHALSLGRPMSARSTARVIPGPELPARHAPLYPRGRGGPSTRARGGATDRGPGPAARRATSHRPARGRRAA